MVSARLFKRELEKYQDASGSLINYNKSQVLSWKCNSRDLTDISKILEIKGSPQWVDLKYLRVPIFKATPKVSSWLPLIEKIKNRISTWGATWLNPAGKFVLLKLVLSNILIYQSSILPAPKGVLDHIESLLKNFLWKGGKHNEKKLPLVSWEKVTKPWHHGGLQI